MLDTATKRRIDTARDILVGKVPRKLLSLRLPADLLERWKATGPGWQTRMAERLSKAR